MRSRRSRPSRATHPGCSCSTDRVPLSSEHATFREIGEYLRAGDLLVVNDSRVIPARLPARRRSGGAVEILVLRPLDDGSGRWEALMRPSRKVRGG